MAEIVYYGSLYKIRIVGDNYKDFKNAIITSVTNGGIVYNDVDTAKAQTIRNFPVQHDVELLEEIALPPCKGMIMKAAKYFDESVNNIIRLYRVFFQYPVEQQTVSNIVNLKFALQVDVFVRCIRTNMINTFEAEVINLKVDKTSKLLYNNFVIKMKEEFATEEEEEESSEIHSSLHRSISSASSTSNIIELRAKLKKAKKKNKNAKREIKELLDKMREERREREEEKWKLLDEMREERREAEEQRWELLDEMKKQRMEFWDKLDEERRQAEKERRQLLDIMEKRRNEAEKEYKPQQKLQDKQ